METIIAGSANDAYMQLTRRFQYGPSTEIQGSQQEGVIHELQDVVIEIRNARKTLVSLPYRALSRRYAAGEFCLFMAQSVNVDDFSFYAKKWKELDTGDGIVCSAYGQRIFSPARDGVYNTNISRFDYALQQLRKNPDSKNAVIMMRDGSDNRPDHQLDRCCTLHIQFTIRDNKLNMKVAMRSSDFWFGLPYDIFWFSMVMQRMLYKYNEGRENKVSLGTYTHECASLHVYQKQWRRVLEAVVPTPIDGPDALFSAIQYFPNAEYSLPEWDRNVEERLPELLAWEKRYRAAMYMSDNDEEEKTKMAVLLRCLKLPPLLETIGSFLVNTIKDRYKNSVDEKYLALAKKEAAKSKCLDRKVGCVLTDAHGTYVVGHNDVIECNQMCNDKEHRICSVVHAEINALNKAGSMGFGPKKAYVTLYPCYPCMKALMASGVVEIIVEGFSHKGATGTVTLLDPAFREG